MPTPTKAPQVQHPPAERPPLSLPSVLAAGAAYAAAELLAGIFIGNFFGWGRAEALIFLALRPWLLLAAAMLLAKRPWRDRLSVGAAGLVLAGVAETILLLAMGAANPWGEAARGLLAGALLFGLLAFVIPLGRWTALLFVAAFLIPNGLKPYEALVTGRWTAPEAAEKRDLMLLSALPLAWAETGPLDPRSRPAAAYAELEREFRIRALDVVDEASLASGRLLLVAQPRALAPAELASLDAWVRRGGRALILTDPMLLWPSELPLGDIRRPPSIGLLGPLLQHWGLSLAPPEQARAVVRQLTAGGAKRRLVLFAPGTFETNSAACTVSDGGVMASCRIGAGRTILVSDADLLHDRLWTGGANPPGERHTRIADNPLVVADLLDRLAGSPRTRLAGSVDWADPAADRRLASLLALLPLLAAATPAAVRRLRRRG